MPFRGHGDAPVNFVILLILGGLVVSGFAPESPWGAWLFWSGVAIAGLIVARMGVDVALEMRDRRRTRGVLRALVALGDSQEAGAAEEAGRLLAALDDLPVGLPELDATQRFRDAALRDGPHRVACLRLALRYGSVGPAPWQEVIREGQATLAEAPLTSGERRRLEQWRDMDAAIQARKRTEAHPVPPAAPPAIVPHEGPPTPETEPCDDATS